MKHTHLIYATSQRFISSPRFGVLRFFLTSAQYPDVRLTRTGIWTQVELHDDWVALFANYLGPRWSALRPARPGRADDPAGPT